MKSVLITALLVLFAFLQYELWFAQDSFSKTWKLHKIIAEKSVENNKLDAQNSKLVADIKKLRSDKSAVEGEARSKLGMIKHGETFYRVVK